MTKKTILLASCSALLVIAAGGCVNAVTPPEAVQPPAAELQSVMKQYWQTIEKKAPGLKAKLHVADEKLDYIGQAESDSGDAYQLAVYSYTWAAWEAKTADRQQAWRLFVLRNSALVGDYAFSAVPKDVKIEGQEVVTTGKRGTQSRLSFAKGLPPGNDLKSE